MNQQSSKKEDRKEEIAAGNDAVRKLLLENSIPGLDIEDKKVKIVLSPGVESSPNYRFILQAVGQFNKFSQEYDPIGEHKSGYVSVSGEVYYFRIDYYDEDFKQKIDPYEKEPCRLLTIMKANEKT
jgi:hypothetical protein